LKFEEYMRQPANPVGSGDTRDPVGFTKLEKMAGKVAGEIIRRHESSEPDFIAEDVLRVATSILKACHEAQEGTAS
jgi:hypothetical protein